MTKPLWVTEDLQQALQTSIPFVLPKAVYGVSIDTRTLNPRDLFVALKGPYQDGHNHIGQARNQGAVAAIVNRHIADIPSDFTQIVVPDSYQTFCTLAHFARNRAQHAQVIGLTGSFGKTSCREALRHILQRQGNTHATERNFNNHWGVPLTLMRMPQDSRFAVLEMGMNHAGEITNLTDLIQPHISLITTIGNAHIGNFNSVDAIADAKSEIFHGMQTGGIAILNKDNPQYQRLMTAANNHQLRIITFGSDPNADIRLTHFTFQHQHLEICIDAAGQQLKFVMNVLGDHWAYNMTGVLACVYALGQDLEIAANALQSFTPLAGRGQIINIPYQDQHIQIIDDTYNGGPQAMHAALQALGRLRVTGHGCHIAILGDMGDLGAHAVAEHLALKQHITDQSVSRVYLYGPFMKHLYDVLPESLQKQHFTVMSDLITAILTDVKAGDCILVKGGHGQWAYDGIMQQVVHALTKLAPTPN